jgi:riboflavin synthase
MFTGIIETLATVQRVETQGSNRLFWLECPYLSSLRIDQSVSHNGVCLTVDALEPNAYRVTAIAETLQKTNLGQWQAGQRVNLERCMEMNGRLDGHIVQGHADATARCISIADQQGSWVFRFAVSPSFAPLMIEKGSIAVNGISLTLFDVTEDAFSVAIIPYTFTHTNLQYLKVNDTVNIEFDIIGKYVNRMQQLKPVTSK